MEKSNLKKLIDVATGRVEADLVIKNANVVDVYNGGIIQGDIAIVDGLIAGVGEYHSTTEIDALNKFATPGFIDSHIHIESSYVSPEELGRLVVPHGTTTIIADPHEIANVCGLDGVKYMIEASKNTALDIKMMLPSCVPATPFENAGAVIDAKEMERIISDDAILGLGEFMNFPGVIYNSDDVLDKIMLAKKHNKMIDGHSPGLKGNALNGYAATLIRNDHECETLEDVTDRISRGMYVMLRQGSACKDLARLVSAVTPFNSRRVILCADDCQPKTILNEGHINNNARMCVEAGLDALLAVQMASLNAAECFGLRDRGAIAPGLRADIVLFDNLNDFKADTVFIEGKQVASKGHYELEMIKHDISITKGSFKVKDFSVDRLKLELTSKKAHAIGILEGGVVTSKQIVDVTTDEFNHFVYNPNEDVVKIAVVERHNNTGNVAVALLKGYGLKQGAIALSIAHDSHNIIVVGVNDEEMSFAVESLIKQDGGIVVVNNQHVLAHMPMPIAGLMSDQSGEWVSEQLKKIHEVSHNELGIHQSVEPVMTLCFMSLPVIPEIKLTDMGLFDVTKFEFIKNSVE